MNFKNFFSSKFDFRIPSKAVPVFFTNSVRKFCALLKKVINSFRGVLQHRLKPQAYLQKCAKQELTLTTC